MSPPKAPAAPHGEDPASTTSNKESQMPRGRRFFPCFLASVLVLGAASSAVADGDNNIMLGIWGAADGETTAFAGAVDYERHINDKISVLGRVGFMTYEWSDDVNEEDGDGVGVEGGFRFYTSGESRGFYIGANLGYWDTDWDFIDDVGTGSETRGAGSSQSGVATFDLGYRFQIGENFTIIPNGRFGNFFAISDDCTLQNGGSCGRTTELGLYAAAGVYFGFTF
jgi:hypothetical protein